MVIKRFPPIEIADSSGLLAIGGDLELESLLLAYSSGIFVWPPEPEVLAWFSPNPRAILFLDDFKIPKSLKKFLKTANFTFAINQNFERVIRSCSEITNRGDQHGTWITESVISAYIELHKARHCHSFETYLDGELVGGLYGVSINGMFAGESMFYRVENASKAAFCFLVENLKAQNCAWIDCQVLTPLLESFGTSEVERDSFLKLLEQSLRAKPLHF